MDNIPVVDFGPISSDNGRIPSEEDWACVSKEIDRILTDIGFVYLKNHGISQEKVRWFHVQMNYELLIRTELK
jgi:isopenicillin N synthase-like dioxygenase